jgi:uncharacterized protein (TIGR02246 family)
MGLDQAQARKLAEDYTAAWNSGSAKAVAGFFAADGSIIINRGKPWDGSAGLEAMANGFYADVPDLNLSCDGIRLLGDHMVYLWTFTGHHSGTRNPLTIRGCEEWDLDAEGRIVLSRGWFDAGDYARQVSGG